MINDPHIDTISCWQAWQDIKRMGDPRVAAQRMIAILELRVVDIVVSPQCRIFFDNIRPIDALDSNAH